MKGTIYLSYRIAVNDVSTAIEVVPSHFAARQIDDGVEYSAWFGDPVPEGAQDQAWNEIEAALSEAGIQFEKSGSGVAFGDPLPWWYVTVGDGVEGMSVQAWDEADVIEKVGPVFPPGTDLRIVPKEWN